MSPQGDGSREVNSRDDGSREVLDGVARAATETSYFLGEGVIFDPLREEVYWVDIVAGQVHRGSLAEDGTISPLGSLEFPDTAGAVGIARSGAMVVAGRHHLYRRDPGGEISRGPRLTAGDRRRLNDGAPDPAGRFLAGTLVESGSSRVERLMRVECDGSVTVLDEDLTLSNGLAWSPDGRLMYSVDTVTRRVFVRDYDGVTGAVGDRRTLATIDDALLAGLPSGATFSPVASGFPDGMTTDAEGCLWVALWGGFGVLRLDPDGLPIGVVRVDAPHVSSVAFAGPDLTTMVITTARQGMTESGLRRYPLAGKLFTVSPGVTGNLPYWWVD